MICFRIPFVFFSVLMLEIGCGESALPLTNQADASVSYDENVDGDALRFDTLEPVRDFVVRLRKVDLATTWVPRSLENGPWRDQSAAETSLMPSTDRVFLINTDWKPGLRRGVVSAPLSALLDMADLTRLANMARSSAEEIPPVFGCPTTAKGGESLELDLGSAGKISVFAVSFESARREPACTYKERTPGIDAIFSLAEMIHAAERHPELFSPAVPPIVALGRYDIDPIAAPQPTGPRIRWPFETEMLDRIASSGYLLAPEHEKAAIWDFCLVHSEPAWPDMTCATHPSNCYTQVAFIPVVSDAGIPVNVLCGPTGF